MKTLQALFILMIISAVSVSGQVKTSGDPEIKTLKTVKAGEPVAANPFEFSGSATIIVYLNDFNYKNEAYCLYSVVNDEIRGISRGMYFSPTGNWLHTHMTYSNVQSGDVVKFRLYDNDSGNWYEFEETLKFDSDMVVADAFKPFELKNAKLVEPDMDSLDPLLNVFPNPAKDRATITYSLRSPQNVVIQVVDSAGRIVDEMALGKKQAGKHQASWDTSKYDHGSYILRMKNYQGVMKQVVLAK